MVDGADRGLRRPAKSSPVPTQLGEFRDFIRRFARHSPEDGVVGTGDASREEIVGLAGGLRPLGVEGIPYALHRLDLGFRSLARVLAEPADQESIFGLCRGFQRLHSGQGVLVPDGFLQPLELQTRLARGEGHLSDFGYVLQEGTRHGGFTEAWNHGFRYELDRLAFKPHLRAESRHATDEVSDEAAGPLPRLALHIGLVEAGDDQLVVGHQLFVLDTL